MSRWFRHYAGMMRDEKLVRVAIQAKQPVERVLWVWGAILESAAEINDGGRFDFDPSEAAYFLRTDEADIRALVDGLTALQRVAGDRVVNWGSRQFESDKSATRQAAYRERKKERDADYKQGDGGVTASSRHGDAPETETEEKTYTEKNKSSGADAPNAGKRKRERKYATAIPDSFEPNWEAATRVGLSRREAERELSKFKNHAAQTGRTCVNWQAAWSNWCINAAQFLKRPPPGHSTQTAHTITPTSRSWNAWKSYFRDNNDSARAAMMDKCGDEGRPFTVSSEWPPGHEMNNAA